MQIPAHASKDATDVTREFIADIVKLIDGQFGLDYAKKNPGLVAALVQTASYNLRTHIQSGVYDQP